MVQSPKKLVSILSVLMIIAVFCTSCSKNSTTRDISFGEDLSSSPPYNSTECAPSLEGKLKISFLDVGQGDCTFIELPNGETLLIDAGNSENGSEIIQYIRESDNNTIDYLVATHPHADHIGGMREVIEEFDVRHIYMPNAATTTVTFENLLDTVAGKGLTIHTAKSGKTLFDYGDLSALFLAPIQESYSSLNNYSAVLMLTYKNQKFLFMGDAEHEIESELSAAEYPIRADLLKLGHHGSDTSSTRSFLEAVAPSVVVISVGTDNSYGHPSPEVLATLKNLQINIQRTDEQGTIIATCDGVNMTLSHRSTSSQPHAPPSCFSSVEPDSPTISASTETQSLTVYVTRTGEKYHRDGCRYLKKSKTAVLLSELDPKKYSPCSVCQPPNK